MRLKDKRVLMILGPRYQDEEGIEPYEFLLENGAHVDVVGLEKGMLVGLHGRAEIEVNMTASEPDPETYDLLLIPGGRSPASLRKHPDIVSLVKEFFDSGRPVAAICHGPQLLAAAGLLLGRKITGYHKVKQEMLDAGADFVDEPVVVDGNLITSREPKDIPLFNEAIATALTT
jgi:protease I